MSTNRHPRPDLGRIQEERVRSTSRFLAPDILHPPSPTSASWVPDVDVDAVLDGHPRPPAYHHPTELSPFTPSEAMALENTAYRTDDEGYPDEEYGGYDNDGYYMGDSDGGHHVQDRY